jgi:hypothetical protein
VRGRDGNIPAYSATFRSQTTKGLSPNNRIDGRGNGVSQQAKARSWAAV